MQSFFTVFHTSKNTQQLLLFFVLPVFNTLNTIPKGLRNSLSTNRLQRQIYAKVPPHLR